MLNKSTTNKFLFFGLTALIAIAFSCKKSETSQYASREDLTKDSIYLYAQQTYLWNSGMPSYDAFNPRKYSSKEAVISAVSYTHLDVYKRQTQFRTQSQCPSGCTAVVSQVRRPPGCGVASGAVSYTHLDVYKRQHERGAHTMLRAGNALRFTPDEIEDFRKLGLDFDGARTQDDIDQALARWADMLNDERPDLLEKIAAAMAKARGIPLPARLTRIR